LNIALTSDLPLTANNAVFELMRKRDPHPRIVWIPPFTRAGRERFPTAQDQFAAFGFTNLEYCDIDEELNEMQLAVLDQFDIIYLTGGDPIGFRRNILRSGFSTRLQQCLAVGCLVVAASGGSMQLTTNVSLFRLIDNPLDKVLAERNEYNALGILEYEILPHLNRLESSFLENVRRYSEQINHDVIGLADGAALLYVNTDEYLCFGQVTRFRRGEVKLIETA
jgi:peptidase E